MNVVKHLRVLTAPLCKNLKTHKTNARLLGNSPGLLSSYSTEITSSAKKPEDTLFRRVVKFPHRSTSIVPVLDLWKVEGNPIEHEEIRRIIRDLRKHKRFRHALEIAEWMKSIMHVHVGPGDIALNLDLIGKVHGLEQAEKYFDGIPDSLRDIKVYSALLNCYADARCLDKAEVLMQKLRELGCTSTLAYNVMMNLYAVKEKHEDLVSLVQEMEDKGIRFDSCSYRTRLHAYTMASDIKKMEKLLLRMEADPEVLMNWQAYAIAANGYLKAGAREKSVMMLKRSEQLIKIRKQWIGYQTLLTMYASLGDKAEVYRIWNLVKKYFRFYNRSFIFMISSLVKLDDLDGAEKILEVWEANIRTFDIRIPNLLIDAYCRTGDMVKALAIINRLVEGGKEVPAITWNHMAVAYRDMDQMDKAVEMTKQAILASHSRWKPNFLTLASCLEYLKGSGQSDEAEELIRLLQERGQFSEQSKKKLYNYIKYGNQAPEAYQHERVDNDKKTEGEILDSD